MNLKYYIRKLLQEIKDQTITCDNCGWEWKKSEGGDDPYTCHKCWHTNKKNKITESLNKNIIRVMRMAPDVKDFAVEMMEHYLRVYGPGKIEKMGFLDFEEMVLHAVWVDYLGELFEFYDEDSDNYDTLITREEKNIVVNWMKQTFRKDMIDFYKEKIVNRSK